MSFGRLRRARVSQCGRGLHRSRLEDGRPRPALVALGDERTQSAEGGLDARVVDGNGLDGDERAVAQAVRYLPWPDEGLAQVLPRPGTDDLDLDVGTDSVAREADHALREIEDADLLAHLESEHAPPSGLGAGEQYETHCLRGAHEEPGHLGIRDGHGTSGVDLALEGGDHAAPAAEHVPEPDRAVRGAGRCTIEHDLLGEPLRCPHHARWFRCLVGRDEDEMRHPGVRGCVDDVGGAEDVRTHRLAGMALEDRHVLVGGGVEDDLRRELDEGVTQDRGIAHVDEQRLDDPDVLGGVVQMRLVVIEHCESSGSELRDLAGDLGTDPSPTACHEHPPSVQELADRVEVDVDLLAAEEVLDLQGPHVLERHAAHPVARIRARSEPEYRCR